MNNKKVKEYNLQKRINDIMKILIDDLGESDFYYARYYNHEGCRIIKISNKKKEKIKCYISDFAGEYIKKYIIFNEVSKLLDFKNILETLVCYAEDYVLTDKKYNSKNVISQTFSTDLKEIIINVKKEKLKDKIYKIKSEKAIINALNNCNDDLDILFLETDLDIFEIKNEIEYYLNHYIFETIYKDFFYSTISFYKILSNEIQNIRLKIERIDSEKTIFLYIKDKMIGEIEY